MYKSENKSRVIDTEKSEGKKKTEILKKHYN